MSELIKPNDIPLGKEDRFGLSEETWKQLTPEQLKAFREAHQLGMTGIAGMGLLEQRIKGIIEGFSMANKQ